LFNALTAVLKGHMTDLPRQTQALHGLLDLQSDGASRAG